MQTPLGPVRARTLFAFLALIAGLLPTFASAATSIPSSRDLSPDFDICAEPLARYTRAPDTRAVTPVSTEVADGGDGDVANPDALIAEDGRGTTLTFNGGASPVLVVDFGQIVSGLLTTVTLESTSPNLRVAVSESLRYLVPDSDTDWGDQGSTIWSPPAGPGSYETGQQTFRYVRLSLDTTGSVTIDALRLYFTPFHGTPEHYAGCFLSSDDLLNRIWYAGAYTLELNTLPVAGGGSTIVDGAKRDRLIWTADLAVQARVEYATHYRPEHVAYALADLAARQRPDGAIPPSPFGDYSLVFYDYCAWWVITLADYYQRTADHQLVAALYPNLERQVEWFAARVRDDGLLAKDGGLEWAYTLNRTGAVTYLNVVYYRALRDAAGLARSLGETDDSNRWNARADALAAAINTHLFDSARGVYVDSDVDRTHVPLDANVMAIAFGVAPRERWDGILAYVREHHWTPYGSVTVDPAYGSNTWHDRRIWPFASYFELLARFADGDDANAWDLLRREWGHMQSVDPASTTWEWMTAGGEIENGFASLAHGWSAGATAALTEHALGIRPLEPGYASFAIDPRPGDLDWASGRVPTPLGPIDASWRRFSGGFSLRVIVPEGAQATALVPAGDNALVLIDGQPAWNAGISLSHGARRDAGRVHVDLPPGQHLILATERAAHMPETNQYLSAPFFSFWEAHGGIPVFGYPLTVVTEERNPDTGEVYLVQYVERQRFEHHPENASAPYEVLLGRLGVTDAVRRGLSGTPPFAPLAGNPGGGDCIWFEATRHSLCGRFLDYWRAHGLEFGDDGVSERESLALFGYPISEPFVDPAGGLTVQYFERARFEFHPANAGTPWEVLLGRLGADLLESNAVGCCAGEPRR